MAQVVKNTLGYLGIDFQFRLINAFIERPNFFKDIFVIIDQNMFTEPYLKAIVGIMKDYYQKYDTTASYSMIEIEARSKAKNDDEIQYYEETLEKLKGLSTEGIDEVEELAEKFFKQQNLVRVANEIRRIAGDGDISKYDECQAMIDNALSIGRHTEEAYSPFDNIEEDLSEENIVTIPTGISKLDDCLGGGLDKGKIGLIMAPMGTGKTSLTTGLAAYAATYKALSNDYQGFKVLHIVFEDTNRDINRKYFSRFSQVETKDLNESQETTNKVRDILYSHPDKEMVKNNIRVMKLDTGEYTARDIKQIIKKKINEGFKPDLVVIDYFECIKAPKGSSTLAKHEQETLTMRHFENDVKELDVALWIPSQGNRSSITSDLVTMDQGSGSIGKQQVAQVVISITRSVDDINNQKAKLSVLKNRSGKAGIILNGIKFNNGTCTIDCDDVVDFDDALAYNDWAEEKEKEMEDDLIKNLRKIK